MGPDTGAHHPALLAFCAATPSFFSIKKVPFDVPLDCTVNGSAMVQERLDDVPPDCIVNGSGSVRPHVLFVVISSSMCVNRQSSLSEATPARSRICSPAITGESRRQLS